MYIFLYFISWKFGDLVRIPTFLHNLKCITVVIVFFDVSILSASFICFFIIPTVVFFQYIFIVEKYVKMQKRLH